MEYVQKKKSSVRATGQKSKALQISRKS